MTAFDAIVLVGLVMSAAFGYSRGAVRELVALFAFSFAALGSLASLPVTVNLARGLVHPLWLAAVTAALLGFVAIFLILGFVARLATSFLDRRSFLGGANRAAGLLFGVARGLVLLGLFGLVFGRVTPKELRPGWIVEARTYPLVALCGRLMQAVAPEGAKLAGGVPSFGKKVFKDATSVTSDEDDAPPEETETPVRHPQRMQRQPEEDVISSDRGYTGRARKRVDDLVETSR